MTMEFIATLLVIVNVVLAGHIFWLQKSLKEHQEVLNQIAFEMHREGDE